MFCFHLLRHLCSAHLRISLCVSQPQRLPAGLIPISLLHLLKWTLMLQLLPPPLTLLALLPVLLRQAQLPLMARELKVRALAFAWL